MRLDLSSEGVDPHQIFSGTFELAQSALDPRLLGRKLCRTRQRHQWTPATGGRRLTRLRHRQRARRNHAIGSRRHDLQELGTGKAARVAVQAYDDAIERNPPRYEDHQAIVATTDGIATRGDFLQGQLKRRREVMRGRRKRSRRRRPLRTKARHS